MANEIQRALNILGTTLTGGAVALAKGLGKKSKKAEEPKKPELSETEQAMSSLGFTTELSSDEAAKKAFSFANNALMQKARGKQLRDAKTGKFVRVKKEEGK